MNDLSFVTHTGLLFFSWRDQSERFYAGTFSHQISKPHQIDLLRLIFIQKPHLMKMNDPWTVLRAILQMFSSDSKDSNDATMSTVHFHTFHIVSLIHPNEHKEENCNRDTFHWDPCRKKEPHVR